MKKGIVEKIFVEKDKEKESENVYYLLYYVVIRRDYKIIKLRIVYDGLVKFFKRIYLLNDCF